MTLLMAMLASFFTVVELNCENLFDCRHDSLRQDTEYLPASYRHWTHYRYWRKVNRVGQEIMACGETPDGLSVPDLVALVEVEKAKATQLATLADDELVFGISASVVYGFIYWLWTMLG